MNSDVYVLFLFVGHFCHSSDSCERFLRRANVTAELSQCRLETFNQEVPFFLCAQLCHDDEQCTGALAESDKTTPHCCLLSENPILVQGGTRLLLHRPNSAVQCMAGWREPSCDQCLFGYNVGCTSCLTNQRFDTSTHRYFTLTFSGNQCSTIEGTIHSNGNEYPISNGVVDHAAMSYRWETTVTVHQGTFGDGNNFTGASTGQVPYSYQAWMVNN